MKSFQRFYLWGIHAKSYMGLYFMGMVFFGGLLTYCYGGTSLPLMTLLQMFVVSMVIGFSQSFLLPSAQDFSRGIFCTRSILWLVLSAVATYLGAQLGGWFSGQPGFMVPLMTVVLVLGCLCLLIGQRMEQNADTIRLNARLQDLQSS